MTKSQKNKLFLAFDYGGKRVGVAMGDASIGIAHPIKAISYKTSKELMAEIERIVSEWKPSALVVGMPQKRVGNHTLWKKESIDFAKRLSQDLN